MAKLFDVKLVFTQIPELLKYLPTTLLLTVVALAIGLIVGLLIALIRMKKIPVLNQLAIAFVSVMRGTPIIVQLYITYFGIPIALKYINYLPKYYFLGFTQGVSAHNQGLLQTIGWEDYNNGGALGTFDPLAE